MAGQSAEPAACCGGPARREVPGYRQEPFVQGFAETPVGPVPVVATKLTWADHLGAALVRLGVGRKGYRVSPGLYAVGAPDAEAPVLVTANYKLTFDALRRELGGRSLWLLVLDTRGINVWCAAGKGTFGTQEVVRRVREAKLEQVVAHRQLILPQLGAPGVSARDVRWGCGFGVSYGPVRAADLPVYLDGGEVTPAMRRVDFPLDQRLAVALVEPGLLLKRSVLLGVGLALLLCGLGPDVFSLAALAQRAPRLLAALVLGFAAGCFGVPALLPWLRPRAFALKGALLGAVLGLPAALWLGSGLEVPGLLAVMVALGSWFGLNFTGSTTFTSPSGVEWELRRYLPWQLGVAAAGLLVWYAAAFGGMG